MNVFKYPIVYYFYLISIIIIGATNSPYYCEKNNTVIDETLLKEVVGNLVPELIDNFLEEIKNDIHGSFFRLNHFIKKNKPTWIYSYLQSYLSYILLQNTRSKMNKLQSSIINNLHYKDSIKLFVIFIDNNLNSSSRIVYYSKKKEKIIKLISEKIFQDGKILMSSQKTLVSFSPDQKLNIIHINPKLQVPQIQKTYEEYLGQKKINYTITPQEKFLLGKAMADPYLVNYDSNLSSIMEQSTILHFCLTQLKQQSVFEKFKYEIFHFLYKTGKLSRVKKKTMEEKTGNITRYILNDDNQDILEKYKAKFIKLRKVDLILSLYIFFY